MRHPNIVRFEECFEDANNVYLIMELCPNKSLIDVLRARIRLTEPEVRFYLIQILGAVKHMHSNKVIHRDLKLGNLLLDSQMNIKVADFGLAALLLDMKERKNTICGTPNYIAPEILFARKDGHSFQVDLWSIGVITYALLIGKPPFQSKDVKDVYRNIKGNSYSFPDSQVISQEAKSLIQSLLNPDPQCRPTLDALSEHPFFRSGPFPASMSVSSRKSEPKYEMTQAEIRANFNNVAICAGIGPQKQAKTISSNLMFSSRRIEELRGKYEGYESNAADENGNMYRNIIPSGLSPRQPAPAVFGVETVIGGTSLHKQLQVSAAEAALATRQTLSSLSAPNYRKIQPKPNINSGAENMPPDKGAPERKQYTYDRAGELQLIKKLANNLRRQLNGQNSLTSLSMF